MLIAFEGLDQSGKETQVRLLAARLEGEGRQVHAVSFPDYQTPIGRELRQALSGEREFGPEVMQLLYIANRFEYKSRLEVWLQADTVVLCDRYQASSVAYGEAQGLDAAWLEDIQRFLPAPGITVLLDISPVTAVARKGQDRDRYERDLPLLSRARASYQRQAATHRWIVVNGEQPREAVTAAIEQAVLPRVNRAEGRQRAP